MPIWMARRALFHEHKRSQPFHVIFPQDFSSAFYFIILQEDARLRGLVEQYGSKKWALIASFMQTRTSKQCRRRWKNAMEMDPKATTWTKEEDNLLLQYHRELGNKWTAISARFGDRTDNAVKNRWHALCRKQPELAEMESPTTAGGAAGNPRRTMHAKHSDIPSSDGDWSEGHAKKRRKAGTAVIVGVTTRPRSATGPDAASGSITTSGLFSDVEQTGSDPRTFGRPGMLPTPFERAASTLGTCPADNVLVEVKELKKMPAEGGQLPATQAKTDAPGLPGFRCGRSMALHQWLSDSLRMINSGSGNGSVHGNGSARANGNGSGDKLNLNLDPLNNEQSLSFTDMLNWLTSANNAGHLSSSSLGLQLPDFILEGSGTGAPRASMGDSAGGRTLRSKRTLGKSSSLQLGGSGSGSGLNSEQRDLLARLLTQARDSLDCPPAAEKQPLAGLVGHAPQEPKPELNSPNTGPPPPSEGAGPAQLQRLLSLGLARSLSLGGLENSLVIPRSPRLDPLGRTRSSSNNSSWAWELAAAAANAAVDAAWGSVATPNIPTTAGPAPQFGATGISSMSLGEIDKIFEAV